MKERYSTGSTVNKGVELLVIFCLLESRYRRGEGLDIGCGRLLEPSTTNTKQ